MAGNMYEMVQDWIHDNYNGAPTNGSAWESPTGPFRVRRSSCFLEGDYYLRTAYRYNNSSPGQWDYIGLRCARDVGLKKGLVSYYSFDTDSRDDFGSIDGTAIGAANIAGGRIGNCYSFNGSSDYIEYDTSAIFDLGSDATYSAFVNISNAPSSEYVLFSKQMRDDTSSGWFASIGSNQLTNIQIYPSLHHVQGTAGAISTGQWVHIAIVYSSTEEKMRIFIDGALDIEESFPVLDLPSVSSHNFWLGGMKQSVAGPFRPINGLVDEFGVWNRALSSQEISTLHNNGNGYNPVTGVSGP
jgi:hypothetical protein